MIKSAEARIKKVIMVLQGEDKDKGPWDAHCEVWCDDPPIHLGTFVVPNAWPDPDSTFGARVASGFEKFMRDLPGKEVQVTH